MSAAVRRRPTRRCWSLGSRHCIRNPVSLTSLRSGVPPLSTLFIFMFVVFCPPCSSPTKKNTPRDSGSFVSVPPAARSSRREWSTILKPLHTLFVCGSPSAMEKSVRYRGPGDMTRKMFFPGQLHPHPHHPATIKKDTIPTLVDEAPPQQHESLAFDAPPSRFRSVCLCCPPHDFASFAPPPSALKGNPARVFWVRQLRLTAAFF